VAGEIHPLAPLAFRLAAVAGARRAELAALRWDRLDESTLVIDQRSTSTAQSPSTTRVARSSHRQKRVTDAG
jgi:integrase